MTTTTQALASYPMAARTTSGVLQAPVDSTRVDFLRLDYNVSAFTGGTAPTITFAVYGMTPANEWVLLYTTAALAAPGAGSRQIGPGLETSLVVPQMVRVDATLGGSVAPTSVAYSLSLTGKGR